VLSSAKPLQFFATEAAHLCDHETEQNHQVLKGGQSLAESLAQNT
jgi:hypothetical protein